jgi:bifunctional DNase/RNase
MQFFQVESMMHNVNGVREPMLLFFINDFGNYRVLPLNLGKAQFIMLSETLEDAEEPYPSSHGLMLKMMELGGVEIKEARITDVEDGFFSISLFTISKAGEETQIPCSPYDLYILSAMKGMKIFVAEDVLEEASHEVPARFAEEVRWL